MLMPVTAATFLSFCLSICPSIILSVTCLYYAETAAPIIKLIHSIFNTTNYHYKHSDGIILNGGQEIQNEYKKTATFDQYLSISQNDTKLPYSYYGLLIDSPIAVLPPPPQKKLRVLCHQAHTALKRAHRSRCLPVTYRQLLEQQEKISILNELKKIRNFCPSLNLGCYHSIPCPNVEPLLRVISNRIASWKIQRKTDVS